LSIELKMKISEEEEEEVMLTDIYEAQDNNKNDNQ